MKYTLPIVLGVLAMVAGCQKHPSAAIGKWSNGYYTLEFKEDGTLNVFELGIRKTQQKWADLGLNLTLDAGGDETYCGVASDTPTGLFLSKKNSIGEQNCRYAGEYWRLDLPKKDRPPSFYSYTCHMNTDYYGVLEYPPEFVIEADSKGSICYGKTADRCRIVGNGNAYDHGLTFNALFKQNYMEMYTLEEKPETGVWNLSVNTSTDCGNKPGLGNSCSFDGAAKVVGACVRK